MIRIDQMRVGDTVSNYSSLKVRKELSAELYLFDLDQVDLPSHLYSATEAGYYIVITVTRGTLVFMLNEAEFTISAEDSCAINGNRSFEILSRTDIAGHALFIKPDYYRSVKNQSYTGWGLDIWNHANPVFKFSADESQYVFHQVLGIIRLEGLKGDNESFLIVSLLQIYFNLIEHRMQSRDGNVFSQTNVFFRQFRGLVEQNYIKEKRSSFYSRQMGLTIQYLNRISQRYIGCTTGELIRKRNVLEAKRLLMSTNLSIKQIAYELNFEDPSYFIRFFKKEMKISPQLFRLSQHHTS